MEKEHNRIHLDKERIKRYKEKLEYMEKISHNFEEWTKNVSGNDSSNRITMKDQFSIYHAFQIMAELVADIIAMVVKDIKVIPKNDYDNIDTLRKKKLISQELSNRLKKINGLRNRLVHHYNDVDEEIAYNDCKSYHSNIKHFVKVIDTWLKINS